MIILTGHSDNVICFNGEIDEEIYTYDEMKYISFSDGTLINGVFDKEGIWKFEIIETGSLFKSKVDGSVETGSNDIIHFNDGIIWCVIGDGEFGECNLQLKGNTYVSFSDGTLLHVFLEDRNVFRQTVVAKGSLYKSKKEGCLIECIDDMIYIGRPIKWKITGECVFKKR